MTNSQEDDGPVEIAIVGDLTDSESDLTDRLLGIEPGGECTIYFDSPGGSPYCAVSLMTLIKFAQLAGDRHRHWRMLVGHALAVCRLPTADCDAVQRHAVSPDALAERGKRRPCRGG